MPRTCVAGEGCSRPAGSRYSIGVDQMHMMHLFKQNKDVHLIPGTGTEIPKEGNVPAQSEVHHFHVRSHSRLRCSLMQPCKGCRLGMVSFPTDTLHSKMSM
jgi:hypothetical protein